MSIRWIRNILLEGDKGTLEILLGDREISDKCYVRINNGPEIWFIPQGETRDQIIDQGIGLLKKHLNGKKIANLNGEDFSWQ